MAAGLESLILSSVLFPHHLQVIALKVIVAEEFSFFTLIFKNRNKLLFLNLPSFN